VFFPFYLHCLVTNVHTYCYLHSSLSQLQRNARLCILVLLAAMNLEELLADDVSLLRSHPLLGALRLSDARVAGVAVAAADDDDDGDGDGGGDGGAASALSTTLWRLCTARADALVATLATPPPPAAAAAAADDVATTQCLAAALLAAGALLLRRRQLQDAADDNDDDDDDGSGGGGGGGDDDVPSVGDNEPSSQLPYDAYDDSGVAAYGGGGGGGGAFDDGGGSGQLGRSGRRRGGGGGVARAARRRWQHAAAAGVNAALLSGALRALRLCTASGDIDDDVSPTASAGAGAVGAVGSTTTADDDATELALLTPPDELTLRARSAAGDGASVLAYRSVIKGLVSLLALVFDVARSPRHAELRRLQVAVCRGQAALCRQYWLADYANPLLSSSLDDCRIHFPLQVMPTHTHT